MTPDPDPVFVLTRDGDVHLFRDPHGAAAWVEAVDVRDGEYDSFTRVDGERLRPVVPAGGDGPVHLEPTGEVDLELLRARLRAVAERNGYDGDDPDPRSVANEVFENAWRNAWPRWWPWLHHRLHGQRPPSI